MLAIWISEAKGSIKEFWQLSPKQFYKCMTKVRDVNELNVRAEWERARWLAYVGIQPHLKPGKKFNLQDLAKFDWENESSKKQKKEEIEAMLKRISKRDNIKVAITIDGEKITADGTVS